MRYTNMRTKAPALAPLFRSAHQLRLLGELFVGAREPQTLSELGGATGIPQPTVSREIARLTEHGIVVRRRRGRAWFVEANRELPWYPDLRRILAQTIGPSALLAVAIATIDSVSEAHIFGSWARRYHGEPGPFPHDIDVVVVGTPDVDAVHRACDEVERELRVAVNLVVVSESEWSGAAPSEFLGQIRERPVVTIREPQAQRERTPPGSRR